MRLLFFLVAALATWVQVMASPVSPGDSGIDNDSTDGSALFLSDQDIYGLLRGDYFYSSRYLDDATFFSGLTVQLKVLPRITDSIDSIPDESASFNFRHFTCKHQLTNILFPCVNDNRYHSVAQSL